jgi:hypothetical protein
MAALQPDIDGVGRQMVVLEFTHARDSCLECDLKVFHLLPSHIGSTAFVTQRQSSPAVPANLAWTVTVLLSSGRPLDGTFFAEGLPRNSIGIVGGCCVSAIVEVA